ncbi:hypothetical protein J6590_030861 [Homalodisca vitripennis]|nr:hypothetical protein J6590_030861 [Homalodisca vitripennis]
MCGARPENCSNSRASHSTISNGVTANKDELVGEDLPLVSDWSHGFPNYDQEHPNERCSPTTLERCQCKAPDLSALRTERLCCLEIIFNSLLPEPTRIG